MVRKIEGSMIATGMRFGIVVSRFNEMITSRLLDGAIDSLKRHGTDEKNIDVAWTPGSFEIPLIVKKFAGTNKYDAIIALGAIIQGDTPHNQYIAAEVSKGIAAVTLESGLPVSFGILTTDNLEQAIERSGTKAGNKGAQAADSAIEMVNLIKTIKK